MPLRILRFTETVDGATYTARTSIPKGARLMDILMATTSVWAANTASLDIGDSDGSDSLITAQDVQAAVEVNVDGASAGSGWPTGGGAYSEGGAGKLYPSGDVITAVVTTTVPTTPTGATTVMLWFEPIGAGQAATVTT